MASDIRGLLGKLAGVDLGQGTSARETTRDVQTSFSEHSGGVHLGDDTDSEPRQWVKPALPPQSHKLPRIDIAQVKVEAVRELSSSTSRYESDSESVTGSTVSPTTDIRPTPSQIQNDLSGDINFIPRLPPCGLIMMDFIKGATHVVNVQFINCIFNERCPTIFSDSQLMNVTFFHCDFRGFTFKRVVMNNNRFSHCTFEQGRYWTNRKLTRGFCSSRTIFTSFDGANARLEEFVYSDDEEIQQKRRRRGEKPKTPIHARMPLYEQRKPSDGQLTGWGVPKGSYYDAPEIYNAAPAVTMPGRASDSLRPGLELDDSPSRGLDMIAGPGELYTLCTFRRCTFENTIIENSIINDVQFENCTFKDFNLKNVVLRNTVYRDCEFSGCTWENRGYSSPTPVVRVRFFEDVIRKVAPPKLAEQAEKAAEEAIKKSRQDRCTRSRVAEGKLTWADGRKVKTKRLDKTSDAERIRASLEDGEVAELIAAPEGVKPEEATVFLTPKWF